MNARLNNSWNSQNPLMQIAAFVLAMLILIVGLVMGAIVFFVLLGFAAVFAVVFWLRLLWIRHKLRKAGSGSFGAAGPGPFGRGGPRGKSESGRVIEVEYTVVGEEDVDEDEDEGGQSGGRDGQG